MSRTKMHLTFASVVSLCSLAVVQGGAYASEHRHGCRQRHFGQFSEWSEPVNLGPVVNSEFNDYHPAISNNGLSLYLTSDRPGGIGAADIWVSQRANLEAPWGPPQHLGPNINGAPPAGGACCPNLSPDEHWLYFSGGGGGSSDSRDQLWVSHRDNTNDDFGWEPAVNLGERLNPVHEPRFDEGGPTYFEDEETGIATLYFARDPGGVGDYDIYAATLRRDGSFGMPALVWELSTPQRDTRTAIRRDGLEMFITSNRPGGLGALDVWVSTRETSLDAWSTPVNAGAPVNSPSADGGPAISCDGTTMYLFSDRPGGFGGRDLYVTTRTPLCDDNGNGQSNKQECDGK